MVLIKSQMKNPSAAIPAIIQNKGIIILIIYKINSNAVENFGVKKPVSQKSLDELISMAFYQKLKEETTTFAPVIYACR